MSARVRSVPLLVEMNAAPIVRSGVGAPLAGSGGIGRVGAAWADVEDPPVLVLALEHPDGTTLHAQLAGDVLEAFADQLVNVLAAMVSGERAASVVQ